MTLGITVKASLVLIFLLIFLQDLRHREVSVLLFLVLFLTSIFQFWLVDGSFQSLGINVVFLFVLYGLAWIIMTIRGTSMVQTIGKGDVVFFLLVIGLFDSATFILFVNGSLVFSLFVHWGVSKVSGRYNKMRSVPLAGFSSLVAIFFLLTPIDVWDNLLYSF